jgi:hypothetical protein
MRNADYSFLASPRYQGPRQTGLAGLEEPSRRRLQKRKRLAMNGRIQISLDPEARRWAKARAAKLKVSLAEYLRRLIAQDLSVSKRKLDISAVFDLADSGPATNIARDKDKMIAKAAKAEHSARRKKVTRKQKESEIVRSGHSEAFALLGEAILKRKPVRLTYHGVRREVCPHIISHTNGAERALVFQFVGSTRSPAGRRVALPAAVPSERYQSCGMDLGAVETTTAPRNAASTRFTSTSTRAFQTSLVDGCLRCNAARPGWKLIRRKIGRPNDRHRQQQDASPLRTRRRRPSRHDLLQNRQWRHHLHPYRSAA